MFSGDATESMFTFSTILNRARGRGPGFYFYLVSPYVLARLVTRFITYVIKEWWQAFLQRRRKDKYVVSSRNLTYGFLRGFMGPILHDLVTFTVISDALRGLPAVYALFSAYDDLAHFAGMQTPEAFEELGEVDRYFTRIEHALAFAPRPYHIVVLSDHGQSMGPTFKSASGMSLEELVQGLIKEDTKVFAALETNEAWDNLNAVLSESTNSNARSASVIRRALASKANDGVVKVGPERETDTAVEASAKEAKVIVMGSGSTGLIYFTESKERMTYEQIQDAHPDLILGLINNPGIGFLLVKSEQQGAMVMTKGGVQFLNDDTIEGEDPLTVYGPNAAALLRRESSFSNCPDLLVNTRYNPQTQELAGFENQASHHGGLGGPQNHPFVLHPASLPADGKPVVGAESVYKLLRSWREQVQGLS
jgi:hypothetical protein